MNQSARRPSRVDELIVLLEEHVTSHEQLADTMNATVGFVRQADVAGMSSVALQQQGLVQRIRQREGLRRQVMDRIGVELGMAPRAGRVLTISQMAGRLAPPCREQLIETGRRLKQAVDRVARLGRVHERISSRMLAHASLVLGAVRPQRTASADYCGDGRTVDQANMILFEAVG